MADRNKNRSDSYQWHLMEITVSPFILGDLSSAQGMNYRLQPHEENERLLDLRDQLMTRMLEILKEGLTNRQNQVVTLTLSGFTQNEIARKLGINQTSVHKVLRGNIDYKNGKKRYGGALKKIIKLCQTDIEIQNILADIRDLYDCLEL